MSDTPSQPLDLPKQIARIDRAIAKTAKYVAEQRKLEAEARNCDRDFWKVVVLAMAAGAALFGAGAAFLKLIGG
jgi:hypothetical protein